jgi:threonine dehydrogenase-like Zn-dependent dehydrogenase
LEDLRERFSDLARERGIAFTLLNPKELTEEDLFARLHAETSGAGFDDIVCLVPSVATLVRAPQMLAPGGGLNIFAGLPVGTAARLDLRPVVERRARFWGTSGSSIADLRAVAGKLSDHLLETAGVVAAVAGIRGVRAGLAAVKEGRYLGKTVIYPHLEGLPLLSVAEIALAYPSVGERLTSGRYWNSQAEAELFRCV